MHIPIPIVERDERDLKKLENGFNLNFNSNADQFKIKKPKKKKKRITEPATTSRSPPSFLGSSMMLPPPVPNKNYSPKRQTIMH